MTKARQRERAKRKKLIAQHLKAVPISAVHGFVNGVEWPLKSWDGHKIQFHKPPDEGDIVTIRIDTTKNVMEGIRCK